MQQSGPMANAPSLLGQDILRFVHLQHVPSSDWLAAHVQDRGKLLY
jgi:hypothetical protein